MMPPMSKPATVAAPPDRIVAPVTVPPVTTVSVLPLDTTSPIWFPLPLVTIVLTTAGFAAVGANDTPRMIESGAAAISWVKVSPAGAVVAESTSEMPYR